MESQTLPIPISEMSVEEVREYVENIRKSRAEANLKRITEKAAKVSAPRGPFEIGNLLDEFLGDL